MVRRVRERAQFVCGGAIVCTLPRTHDKSSKAVPCAVPRGIHHRGNMTDATPRSAPNRDVPRQPAAPTGGCGRRSGADSSAQAIQGRRCTRRRWSNCAVLRSRVWSRGCCAAAPSSWCKNPRGRRGWTNALSLGGVSRKGESSEGAHRARRGYCPRVGQGAQNTAALGLRARSFDHKGGDNADQGWCRCQCRRRRGHNATPLGSVPQQSQALHRTVESRGESARTRPRRTHPVAMGRWASG
jgi:hypothetical protein